MHTKNKQKILILLFSPKLSGAEIAILRLIKHSENNIYLFCGNQNLNIVKNYVEKERIFVQKSIKSLNRNNNFFLCSFIDIIKIIFNLNRKIFSFIKKNNIRVFYANNSTLAFYSLPFLFFNKFKRNKIKTFWHEHTLIKKQNFLQKLNYYFYDKTIVSSQAVKNTFKESKVLILHYGINGNNFTPNHQIRREIRKLLKIDNKICIGIFGVISEHKGHKMLIDAFKRLENNENLELLIVGKVYDSVFFDKLELNRSNIRVIEWTDNIHLYYNAIDILVNATTNRESEAFGLTIAEAMLNEKIVVCSNTGGISELVKDNWNGFLFEPDNINELERKLKFVIRNINSFSEITTNAKKSVMYSYSMEQMIKKFDQIINE